jgi:hypothetical protein
MNLIIIITSHRILRFIWNKLRILSVLLEILLGHLIIVMILLLLNRQCLSVISLLIILKIFIYLYLYLRVLRHSIHRLSVINNRLRRRNSIRCLWSIYYLVIKLHGLYYLFMIVCCYCNYGALNSCSPWAYLHLSAC